MANPRSSDPISFDIVVMLCYNAMLLIQVFGLGVAPGNVLWVFWVENVFIGIVAFIALRHAKRSGNTEAKEFLWSNKGHTTNMAQHPLKFLAAYGFFSLVHMVFSVVLGFMVGVEITVVSLGLPILMALARQVTSCTSLTRQTGHTRDLLDRRTVADAMTRMVVLHLAIILGWIINIALLTVGLSWNDTMEPVDVGTAYEHSQAVRGRLVVTVLVIGKTIGEYLILRRSRNLFRKAVAEPGEQYPVSGD